MEAACIRHTDLPGTSRLFADFSYHFDRVARFYRHDPHNPASFAAVVREIEYPDARRAALVSALASQNGGSNRAGESLARLAQPGTVAIVTGQQVGLIRRTGLHDLQGAHGGSAGSRSHRARHSRGADLLARLRGS